MALAVITLQPVLGVTSIAANADRVYADASRPDFLEIIHMHETGGLISGGIDRYGKSYGKCRAVGSRHDLLAANRNGYLLIFRVPHGASAKVHRNSLRLSEPGARGTHVFTRIAPGVVPMLIARFIKHQALINVLIHPPNTGVGAAARRCE